MKKIITVIIAILVNTVNYASAGALIECTYTANDPMAELQSYRDCAQVISGKLAILPEHLKKIHFGPDGLATIRVSEQIYYIKPNGDLLPVITYDNWADTFSEGLTRSRVNGKVAFFNADFRQVIPPKYDWAWPFEVGRALVCNVCSAALPDIDGHTSISGGRWGYINQQGGEVVPVKFSKEEVLKQK